MCSCRQFPQNLQNYPSRRWLPDPPVVADALELPPVWALDPPVLAEPPVCSTLPPALAVSAEVVVCGSPSPQPTASTEARAKYKKPNCGFFTCHYSLADLTKTRATVLKQVAQLQRAITHPYLGCGDQSLPLIQSLGQFRHVGARHALVAHGAVSNVTNLAAASSPPITIVSPTHSQAWAENPFAPFSTPIRNCDGILRRFSIHQPDRA